jgi:hypothetical protein
MGERSTGTRGRSGRESSAPKTDTEVSDAQLFLAIAAALVGMLAVVLALYFFNDDSPPGVLRVEAPIEHHAVDVG